MKTYCKILIVDDELIMREGISHMVDWEKEGFKIIGQASNGQEAIDIIQNEVPNIVITDVVMPKVDGIELAKYLQENYPEIKILVLSSYSDFDYVKSSFKNGAVDYILKPSLNLTQLLETLKKSTSSFLDLSISNKNYNDNNNELYMLNNILSDSSKAIDFKYLEKIFYKDSFCLFGINIKNFNYSYKSEKEFIDTLNYQIDNNISSEYFTKKFNFKDEYLLIIFNFNNDKYEELIKRLNLVSSNCASKFNNAFFVLSKVFSNINKLKDIFENDFLELCKEGFYHKDSYLIVSSKFKIVAKACKFDFKHFSILTSKMEIEEALNMLTSYVNEVISQKSLNELDLKTLIQNCFYNIISTLESFDDNNTNLENLKYKCLSNISQSKYSKELMENYNKLLLDFNEIISEYQNRINSHMINKIIKYIRENYSEPLNLSDLAELFNFNYYYLSSYFSSHIKEGFNEFLNKIRIEKACEFLKHDIPISNISSMVGYSDHSYFCKVFKKFTGTTPSNFKKKSFKL